MIACKLSDLISVFDLRTKIEFIVSSMERFARFEGNVSDFRKNYLYQVFATENVCEIKIINRSLIDKVVRIVVTTATE